MSRVKEINDRPTKLSETMMLPKNTNLNLNNPTKKLKKSASNPSNDFPDILKVKSTNIFKAEKLSNFRRENKHMTQIPQQVDKPDILFGISEYKEINKSSKSTRFHSIKKLKSCNSSPDLPDVLVPLTEDFYNTIPRPESMTKIKRSKNEESKNPEISNEDTNKRPSVKNEEQNLTDIKEIKNETEENKNNKLNNEQEEKK